MNTFYDSDSYGSSEARMMTIRNMKRDIDDEVLQVPPYQREYVWTKTQQQGYLQTLSKVAPLFGPIINIDRDTGTQYIMDGQNRLYTIYKFLNDEISFVNEEDETIKYSNLSLTEQRKLNSTNISYTETRDWTNSQCQEFFMNIQEGVKLKAGELIHAKPDNPLTIEIEHIYPYFATLFTNKGADGGLGLSKGCIDRYGHYEVLGTLIHMLRTEKYPARPGKTALQEFKDWGSNSTTEFNLPVPTSWHDDTCAATETKLLLYKYSLILKNVHRSRTGMTLPNHLRLLYFIFKTNIYHEELSDIIYSNIETLLTRVLDKDSVEYNEIRSAAGYSVDDIYNMYLAIYNE
jgi:hypothetical protein